MKFTVLEDVYYWSPFTEDNQTLALTKGEEVYLYTGATYGVLGPNELPVTREPEEPPFFGVEAHMLGVEHG